MEFLNDKELLFALLAKGHTVITPNNRLSDSLLVQYFKHQCFKTLDKPRCLPYSVALVQAYARHHHQNPQCNPPTLLNTNQCQFLWQKIIRASEHITYSEGLLNAVLSAWERCEQWQVNPEDSRFCYTPQTQQFQHWWQSFNQELNQRHLIAECQVIPYLIKNEGFFFPHPVIWACFDDFTPQQRALQNYLQEKQCPQYHYELQEKLTPAHVLAATDENEELQHLVTWLHQELIKGNQHIGVVIPDLQQRSSSIERTLKRYFTPEQFNITLGQPLHQFPLIAHALSWLQLDLNRLTQHHAALLLQSPYLAGSKEEFLNRCEYLQESKILQSSTVSYVHFAEELKSRAPQLEKCLVQLKTYPEEATVEQWIDLFQTRLNTLGFPGSYGLNSENYQCLNRFTLLLDELRQLHLLSPSFTKAQALAALNHLAQNTIFQAQKINAPIQISGLLEASGCEFDSLWVMGLTDHCLPQKVHLSAFIPPQLQRELQMPHSLPERELQFAKQILDRLKNSARAVCMSYPQIQGDNPNLPCSLITHWPALTPLALITPSSANYATWQDETYQVPWLPTEPVTGGTSLLANQAKCPFKAFAEHRLYAKGTPVAMEGIDVKTRGQILHKVMELLWTKINTQQELVQLEPKQLTRYIKHAINTALTSLTQHIPTSLQELESIRLERLVTHYLNWEKTRPPFRVLALEQSYEIDLAGLIVQVRVDRLDEVAQKKWVIDYKSSLPASKPWNEERPREPQLLLYSLLDEEINTLLFLQLKAGNIQCSGLSEDKHYLSGISTLKKEECWEARRSLWQEQLTELAVEIQEGHCSPNPIQPSLCQQCDFKSLCRIEDQLLERPAAI